MLMAVMAPSKVAPPDVYAKWTWVKELGLRWDDVGGIDQDDINELVDLINIEREYGEMKARVQQGTKSKRRR